MSRPDLYPLSFNPILKDKIWGGSKLRIVLGKNSSDHCGESWELSGVDGNSSIIANGPLKGKSLKEVIDLYKGKLVGEKVYAKFKDQFPLLIKFIDAKKDLSVQLHPDDKLALKKHNAFGKTEMWYVMQADPGAKLIVGLSKKVTKEEYKQHVTKGTIQEVLQEHEVKSGDCFFISPGLIHAIGSGVLLAEIQQTSDITYRVYDYDRKDSQGKFRELHQEEALEAMDFNHPGNYKIQYHIKENTAVSLVENEYFKTSVYHIKGETDRDLSNTNSFVILIGIEGLTHINVDQTYRLELQKGQTLLIPATSRGISLKSEESKLLQVIV
ncbi:class I mannose-6-phosphate isomerase [Gangjinia marincola]|uniref:Phosphohexomutase n=1 Tax=Gangjinia marincola TaxID=578463 RepID=A0ABN1MFQ8_9FLAO